MADTFGSLVDKLTTVDLKMWTNQEIFYKIRKMTFEEFKEKYFKDDKNVKELWQTFQKVIDLNLQRNVLINELDQKIIEMMKAAANGEDLDNGKFIQRAHKTY